MTLLGFAVFSSMMMFWQLTSSITYICMYPLSFSAPGVLVGGDISFGAYSNDPTFISRSVSS
jgi:hypothetical protein